MLADVRHLAAPLAARTAAPSDGDVPTSPSPARRRARTRSSTRTRPGSESFDVEADLRRPARPRHHPRPRPLAPAARHAPRPGHADDARADGARGRPPHRATAPWSSSSARWRGRCRMSPLARVSEEQARRRRARGVEGEVDASNAAELGDRLRALADQPQRCAGRRPRGDDLPRQRGHQPPLRARRRAAPAPAAPAPRRRRRESPIARMLAITGLDVTVPTHATREAAVAAAR